MFVLTFIVYVLSALRAGALALALPRHLADEIAMTAMVKRGSAPPPATPASTPPPASSPPAAAAPILTGAALASAISVESVAEQCMSGADLVCAKWFDTATADTASEYTSCTKMYASESRAAVEATATLTGVLSIFNKYIATAEILTAKTTMPGAAAQAAASGAWNQYGEQVSSVINVLTGTQLAVFESEYAPGIPAEKEYYSTLTGPLKAWDEFASTAAYMQLKQPHYQGLRSQLRSMHMQKSTR